MAASYYQGVFTLVCSHANHLSHSLSHLMWQELHNMQRMQVWSLPFPSFVRDRQQPTFVNSFNWFQLYFSYLLLGCTLNLTGCDCHQLLATTFICLLLSCALILTSCNWSQLLPASCKHIHPLAV